MAFIYDLVDTWNNAASTFTAIKMNVTDTASNAASLLMDLQVGTVSKFKVTKFGVIIVPQQNGYVIGEGGAQDSGFGWTNNGPAFYRYNSAIAAFNNGASVGGPNALNLATNALGFGTSPVTSADTFILREVAGTLAQRNSTNSQTYRLYGTYTDASNYERGYLTSDTNGFTIGTEAAGTGTRRPVRINDTLIIPNAGSNYQTDAPGIYFGSTLYGFRYVASGAVTGIGLNNGNTYTKYLFGSMNGSTGSDNFIVPSVAQISWSSVNNTPYGIVDLFLTRRGAANLRLGAADAASAIPQILSVQSVVAGTTNTNGADFTITGSQGTGTGAGGSIIFQTAPAGTSGTTQNALQTTLSINPTGTVSIGGLTIDPSNGGLTFNQVSQVNIQSQNALILRHGNGDGVVIRPYSSGLPNLLFANTNNATQTALWGETANVLAQRNGVNSQTFRLYNTYTDVSNYSRLAMYSDASANYYIGTQKLGTGASASLTVGTGVGSGVTGHGLLILQGSSVQVATQAGNIFNITSSGHMSFNTDNTYDIGLSGANRPRSIYAGSNIIASGYLAAGVGSAVFFGGNARSKASSPADGDITLSNAASTDFAKLQFGGTTSAFPALKRSSTAIAVRLADDSADAPITASSGTFSDTATNVSALAASGYSLTGSSSVPMIDLTGTWNTTGNPAGIKMNITNTASGANAMLMDLQTGGVSRFNVSKAGVVSAVSAAFSDTTSDVSSIVATGYSLTGSSAVPMVDLSGTWNTTGTPTLFKMNVVDNNSNAASLLMDLQVGGVSRFKVGKDGLTTVNYPTSGVAIFAVGNGNGFVLSSLGSDRTGYNAYGARFQSTSTIEWSSTNNGLTGGDTILLRDAAGALAQRNATNAQTFRLYNTYTDASNYSRLSFNFGGSYGIISTENAGTGGITNGLALNGAGTSGQILFQTSGNNRWAINPSGHFLASADNTYDIGASGANRPRNIYSVSVTSQSLFTGTTNGVIGSSPTGPSIRFSGSNFVFYSNENLQNDFSRINFGGTTSAFPALKRSSTTLQVRLADDSADAPLSASSLTTTDTTTNVSAIASTGYALSGSSSTPMVDLAGTWNTTGTPTAIKLNVTDTASNTNSLLMDLQVGGVSEFSVSKTGTVSAPQFITPNQTLTDGATITFNADLSSVGTVTLTGSGRTITPTNLKAGGTYVLFIKQDGTGNRTITTWTNFRWQGGIAPTLSTTANAIDIVSGISDGTYLYAAIQQGFA